MKEYIKPEMILVSVDGGSLLTASVNSEQGLKNVWKDNGVTDYDTQTISNDIWTGPLD